MNKAKRRFYEKIFRGLGWTIALIGLFFDFTGNDSRELTYFVNPVRFPIVTDASKDLINVYVGDSLIPSNVSLVRLGLWNAGSKEIRQDDIRDPLRFRFTKDAQVLNAKVIAKTNELVIINIDTTGFIDNSVVVSWNILEKMEGGAIDVVYVGELDTEIYATCRVVGQKELSVLHYENGDRHPDSVSGRRFSKYSIHMILELIILLSALAMSAKKGSFLDKYCRILFGRKYKKSRKQLTVFMFVILTLNYIFNIYDTYSGVPDFAVF